MLIYTVWPYLGDMSANPLDGWQPGQPVASPWVDWSFHVRLDPERLAAADIPADSLTAAEWAAEQMWVIGNRMGADTEGNRWPSFIRSLSVTDVVQVREPIDGRRYWLAARPCGWEPIEAQVPRVGGADWLRTVGAMAPLEVPA